MEAKLLLHATKFPSLSTCHHQNHLNHQKNIKHYYSPVSAILVSPAPAPAPADSRRGITEKDIARLTMDTIYIPTQKTTVYNDNWFDKIATNYLTHNVQAAAGIVTKRRGYEGLVEATRAVHRFFDPATQRNLVILALDKAFPRPILNLIRALLPQSKFTREYFAAFTTVFFAWLVGPCEVKESEFKGRREKNVVHIKKCRFLEQTNCVGMCLNLCKMPCQSFIKDSLGMPVNMVPNFEDMSCEMVFGQEPPLPVDDPAMRQPCYSLCKAKQRHNTKCITDSE